ncbi:hypothetical protein KY336_03080 [Candidatus Woesearchaeota archaeon]|nr:hypothetical protein [Candidatus Woesearchaeota archaeon]
MSLTRAVLTTSATLLLLETAGCGLFGGGDSVRTDEIDAILKAKPDSQVGSIHNRYQGADARRKQLLEEAAAEHEKAKQAAEEEWKKNSQGTIQEVESAIHTYYQNIQMLRAHGPYLMLQVQYAGIMRSIEALRAENVDYAAINTDEARSAIETNNSEIETLAKKTEPILKHLNERDEKIRYFSALIRIGLDTLKKMAPGEYQVKKDRYETMLEQIEGFLAASPGKKVHYETSKLPPPRAVPKTDAERESRLDELAQKFRPAYESKKK